MKAITRAAPLLLLPLLAACSIGGDDDWENSRTDPPNQPAEPPPPRNDDRADDLPPVDVPPRAPGADARQQRRPTEWTIAGVTAQIGNWGQQQRATAQMMMEKYGPPQGVDPERLTWYEAGDFKRIELSRQADAHDFPLPHLDYLEHTVAYRVDPDFVSELTAFDGSATVDRTRGELSARCDLESHNILTLNLAHQVLSGDRSADEARETFMQAVMDEMTGKNPRAGTDLQFTPATARRAADPGEVSIAGAPVRPGSVTATDMSPLQGDGRGTDAEALGFLTMIDMNDIAMAAHAATEDLTPAAEAFARKMHADHGRHLETTMDAARRLNVSPLITREVMVLRLKGADELARIVPLDGREFERAFLTAIANGHNEALQKIDELITNSRSEPLRDLLTETRATIRAHLDHARQLQQGRVR